MMQTMRWLLGLVPALAVAAQLLFVAPAPALAQEVNGCVGIGTDKKDTTAAVKARTSCKSQCGDRPLVGCENTCNANKDEKGAVASWTCRLQCQCGGAPAEKAKPSLPGNMKQVVPPRI